jgi:tetratricopeptide (TPR) repeat protein
LRLLALGRVANLERALGEIDAAEKHYRLAFLEGPAPEIQLNLADLLLEKGEFAEASRHYGTILAKDPKMGEARMGEVNALILSGDWAGARQKLESALTEDPPSGALVHLMARLLASAPDQSQRDGARSLHLAETILRARPSSFHAETLALALAENGRFPEAIALIDRLLAENGARESRAVVEYWRALRQSFAMSQAWRAAPPGRFFRPR